MAFRSALVWACFSGFHNMIFESDSLQIIEALRVTSTNLSPVGQIIEDIKALLSTITEASSSHSHRQANAIAHRLARFGLTVPHECIWLDSLPTIILDILLEDSLP